MRSAVVQLVNISNFLEWMNGPPWMKGQLLWTPYGMSLDIDVSPIDVNCRYRYDISNKHVSAETLAAGQIIPSWTKI